MKFHDTRTALIASQLSQLSNCFRKQNTPRDSPQLSRKQLKSALRRKLKPRLGNYSFQHNQHYLSPCLDQMPVVAKIYHLALVVVVIMTVVHFGGSNYPNGTDRKNSTQYANGQVLISGKVSVYVHQVHFV